VEKVFAALALSLLSFAILPKLAKQWRLHLAVSLPIYGLYFFFLFRPNLWGVEGLVLLTALLIWIVFKKTALEASLVAVGVYLMLVGSNYLTAVFLILQKGEAISENIPFYVVKPFHWQVFSIYTILLVIAYRLVANSMRKKMGSFKISHLMLIFADGAIVLIGLFCINFLYRFFVRSSGGIQVVPGLSELLFFGVHAAFAMLAFLIYLLNSFWVTHFNFKAFQSVADIDTLTGVLNRSSGFKRLAETYRSARVSNGDFVICFIDVNNLKSVNDIYGHKEGDIMIKLMADALTRNLRDVDYACRIGGDEFLLCFSNCGLEAGERAWRRIGQEIESLSFKHDKPYRMSVSHGIVSFSENKKLSLKGMIEKADQLMYERKRRMKGLLTHESVDNSTRVIQKRDSL